MPGALKPNRKLVEYLIFVYCAVLKLRLGAFCLSHTVAVNRRQNTGNDFEQVEFLFLVAFMMSTRHTYTQPWIHRHFRYGIKIKSSEPLNKRNIAISNVQNGNLLRIKCATYSIASISIYCGQCAQNAQYTVELMLKNNAGDGFRQICIDLLAVFLKNTRAYNNWPRTVIENCKPSQSGSVWWSYNYVIDYYSKTIIIHSTSLSLSHKCDDYSSDFNLSCSWSLTVCSV